jgi:hypothetical protein
MITESQIKEFSENGYFIVPGGFSQTDIDDMRLRLENIVRGEFEKQGRRFQAEMDSGKYEDVSHKAMVYLGPNVAYRKIADLEYDDVFLKKLQSEFVAKICGRLVGDAVSIMRVTMMDVDHARHDDG